MCNALNPYGTEYTAGASVSSRRVVAAVALLAVMLALGGCATVRGLRDIVRKDRSRERVVMLKPPLPESALAVWWGDNGNEALATAAAVLGVVLSRMRAKG